MNHSGYYEIVHHLETLTGLKMRAMAGNVQFNRLHWHDSLEIMCCVHGSFSMRFPDGSLTLRAGDLITVDGGLPHEIYDGTSDGLQMIFSVDTSQLRLREGEHYSFSTVGPDALSADHPDIQEVRTAIARLICLLPPKTNEHWYTLHMEFYRILTALSRHITAAPVRSPASGGQARFLRCLEIVHQDYEKPISAATLAAEIGFSEPTIYRLFQNHMGVSFTEYLNSVRISAACGHLEASASDGSNLSMTELAACCGYTSLSNFYRAFHQFTGLSPREYRKLQHPDHRTEHTLDYRTLMGSTVYQHDLLQMNQFQPLALLPESYTEDIHELAGRKRSSTN